MCNLLKVATNPIIYLAIDLELQKQQKYGGHKILCQYHSQKKNLTQSKNCKFKNVEGRSDLLIRKILK